MYPEMKYTQQPKSKTKLSVLCVLVCRTKQLSYFSNLIPSIISQDDQAKTFSFLLCSLYSCACLSLPHDGNTLQNIILLDIKI